MKKLLQKLGLLHPEEFNKGLWFDRDSIHFRPYITTIQPDERLDFNATFEYLKKIQKRQWLDNVTSDIKIDL